MKFRPMGPPPGEDRHLPVFFFFKLLIELSHRYKKKSAHIVSRDVFSQLNTPIWPAPRSRNRKSTNPEAPRAPFYPHLPVENSRSCLSPVVFCVRSKPTNGQYPAVYGIIGNATGCALSILASSDQPYVHGFIRVVAHSRRSFTLIAVLVFHGVNIL